MVKQHIMVVKGIKQAIEAFNTIDEFNEDEILDAIKFAIEEETEHDKAIMLDNTVGFEEIGYDNFEPSDSNLLVYTDLYNAMLRMGVDSLDFIAFAHLRYTEDENGRKFYKGTNQIIY